MEMAGVGVGVDGITERREMEMDVDEIDSLFEGLVLFTPSQLAEDHVQEQKQDLDHPEPESQNSTQHQQVQVQEPLDENLFSDLILQTPLDQPEPGPHSATAFSRQGRDNQINKDTDGHDGNHPSLQPSPSLHSSNTTTTTISLVLDSDSKSHQGQAQQQQQRPINDAEAEFEQIKAQIANKLNRAHELAASVSAARKDSIRRRRKAAGNLHLATIRLGDLEKQLEDAYEAEDFEAADRISESFAAAEKNKQALLTALRDAETQCNAIDSKMVEVLNFQIAVEEECASLLHRFSEDATSNADLVFKKSEAQSSEEREKWLSSTKALELNKIELQIEAHLVDDARAVFNTSLDSLIQDDKREKAFLCNQKDILTDELQKLLALVKDKEKEIAENGSKIKQVEQRIADMFSGFQEMQSSIDSKYDNLQSHLSQMDIESETLSKKKEEIDKLLAEEEDRGIKLKELARIL
ncbi:hypothetical protein CRYUN_Cryun38cG0046300 [Craigia yunnanensis]